MDRDDRMFFVPEATMAVPLTGEAIVGSWWVVHPERGLAFWYEPRRGALGADPKPQCNAQEVACRLLAGRLYPDLEVRQVPVAFVAHAVREARRILDACRASKAVASA